MQELVAAVRGAVVDTFAEYARLPFFVRPLVRRGFAQRTGYDREGWLALLAGALDARAVPALERLAAHYDTAPERARRGMGAAADELREVERRAAARATAVRALAAALR